MVIRRVCLRLGLLATFLFACIAPVAARADDAIGCDEFANPAAAQYLLDLDASYASDLDPDGDGIACNEDGAGEPLSDEDYVYAVWDEVDLLVDSVLEFVEVIRPMSDDGLSDSEQLQIFEEASAIAETWVDYPQRAPRFDAPRGFEEIDALYHTWVETVGGLSLAWQAVVDDGETGEIEDDTIEAFDTAIHAFGTTSDDLIAMLSAAEGEFIGGANPGEAIAMIPARLRAG